MTGTHSQDTAYTYGASGSRTSERKGSGALTGTGGVVTAYLWDRRGRLSGIDRNADGDSADVGETTYTSDSTGIRTGQSTRTSTTATSTTAYLNDPSNPIGHAKAVEEWVNGTLTRSYTFGRSVLSQTGLNGERGVTEILYLLTDPGGSTRALVGSAGQLPTATYTYDAFGEALGFDPDNT